jgi:transposase-like protein
MFWMPGAPAASSNTTQTEIAAPDKKVYDPMNKQPIRPKELVTIDFTPSKAKNSDTEFNVRYMCPSCYKNFANANRYYLILT